MPARGHTHLPWLTVLAALAAVLLAACGGSTAGSAGGSSHAALTVSNLDRYPACMRDHGVTDFPDPRVRGTHFTLQLTPSIVGSRAFKSAQKVCAYLLPPGADQTGGPSATQQQAQTEGLLAFAACVREHGFPSFPDPTSQGQLTPAMINRAGIDLDQPAVLRAGDACVAVSHGQITRGDVAQAVTGTGTSGSGS